MDVGGFSLPLSRWLILYVILTGGITEAIMQVTPDSVRRRLWGVFCTIIIGMIVGIVGSLNEGLAIMEAVWRGIMTVGMTVTGYDTIKSVYSRVKVRKE